MMLNEGIVVWAGSGVVGWTVAGVDHLAERSQ